MADNPTVPGQTPTLEDSLAVSGALGDPANGSAAAGGDGQPEPTPRPPAGVSGRGRFLRRWITIRDQPNEWEKFGAGFCCLVLVILIWALLTSGEPEKRIVGPYTLPSIAETFDSFPSLWFDRALARSTVWSLGRVLGGFLLAAAFAVPLGVVAACYPRVNAFFRPLSIFGRNVPIAALIPLTLMWFGLGETQKVMFIFLASVAFIFFDTSHAVDRVSNRFLDTAYTLGAKATPQWGLRRSLGIGVVYAIVLATGVALFRVLETPGLTAAQIFGQPGPWVAGVAGLLGGFLVWFPIQAHQAVRKVLLPLALPNIVNSLRLLFGIAFGYIMLAEVINAKLGLGNIIIMSQRRGPREHIYLILVIIALLAFAIDRLVLWGQKRWFPYRDHVDS